MIISLVIVFIWKRGVSWKWVILWTLWAARLVRQPTEEVQVKSGLLRGSVANDGKYLSYLGIPYATVRQRFQAPGPEPTWKGVFEAIDENKYCTQKWMGINFVSGHEDCLILNIYTPLDALSNAPLPVMVFIHGGGFFSGSGSSLMYGPDYIVSKGVILVTFNYRLDILGQLCLKTKEVPGNAAMKDQVAALRWIQGNIKAFGGDPNDVTIFGESAGGVSVSYHLLSPMSKGLFHKAILQSGSSLAGWAHQYDSVNTASRLASVLGYDTQDPNEIYNIFMNKTDKELVSAKIERNEGSVLLANMHFSPCVENIIDEEEAFLTELPYKLLNNEKFNKVPMIIGTNDGEGYFFMKFERDYLTQIKLEKSLPPDLIFSSQEDVENAARKLKNMYLDKKDISIENLLEFSRFEGESHFTYPSAEETEFMLKNNDKPIYNYVFNYSGRRNVVKFISGEPISSGPGASHADDLFYLFNQFWLPVLGEKKMIERMTTLWTNFAKYGNPTPDSSLGFKWEPTKKTDPSSLVLGAETPYTQPLWHSESLTYWRELYSKYRRLS